MLQMIEANAKNESDALMAAVKKATFEFIKGQKQMKRKISEALDEIEEASQESRNDEGSLVEQLEEEKKEAQPKERKMPRITV